MKVNLGASEIPSKTTDQLLAGYSATNTAAEDRYLETLYYQFGRYLLISCSREGSLPANLQGIWAQGLSSPWSADYHTNINLQMNYWLAEQTNLAECHTPVIDYTNSLVEKGKVMANIYYCRQDGGTVRGWVTHHENNIWGNTAPGNSSAFYFPAAAAWMCQDIWEYYAFNQDKAFLRENYDTMLQAALFWVDNLWTDSRDGTLVSTPSYSPEHGPFSLGATSDQAIIWQLFENVIEASEELEISSPELQEIRTAQSKLSKPSIGLGGQLMEWKDEITLDLTGDGGHRHVNHLYLLHPGNYVVAGRSEQDNAYAEAMKVTLNTRGDEGTGWSKAWKINMWARLRDGDRAQKLLKEQLTGSTLENLFDTHPPFQIDGNFGATAGMTEMLLQSEGDSIDLLAALPSAWPNGSFSGLKARGNFEIDASWENAIAQSFTVKSLSGESCTLRYQELASAQLVRASDGTAVPFTASDNNTITFATDAGETYYLRGLSQDVKVNRPVTFLGVMANNLYNGSIVAETGAPSNNGVYLYDVEGTSFASNVGFRQNDVITRLGGTDIGSTTKLEEVYGAISDGTVVAAVVWRSGTPMTLTFTKTSYEGCIYLPGKIEAEAYDEISGNVRAEGCGEGGQNLGYIVNGDCAVYKNVYFAAVPESFSIRSAGGSPQITLRLDSPSGPIVAQLNPSGTSGWQTYTTSTVDVSNSHLLSGKHDLYLCMNSGININWFSFNGSTGIVPTTGTTEPPEPTEPPTPAGKADLVVTLIGIEPEDPIAGEEVTFRAEIQNVGTGETPAVKHGLSVLVDGVQVNWCDTHVTSLGPGESATLVCNGGPQGKATWSAEAGSHTVEAIIDDVYLIEETEEGNNRLSQTFTSVKAGAGDLVITDVRTSGRPVRGEGTDFNIFVKNEGENAILGAAVEADVYIDARFFRRVRSEELRFMPDGTVMLQAENWKGIYGTHTVRVELNPENGVMETNTANNRRSALVKVADI